MPPAAGGAVPRGLLQAVRAAVPDLQAKLERHGTTWQHLPVELQEAVNDRCGVWSLNVYAWQVVCHRRGQPLAGCLLQLAPMKPALCNTGAARVLEAGHTGWWSCAPSPM